MIAIDEVSEDDVLEVVFYSMSVGGDVRIAIDVDLVGESVVRGEVKVVKNMPFDALEGEVVRLDVDSDEVQKDSHYGPVIGRSIELVSV